MRMHHITDFGLATQLPDSSRSQATESGVVKIAPAYMNPENADGRLKFVDHASGVYRLGSILYERFTGRPSRLSGSALDAAAWLALVPKYTCTSALLTAWVGLSCRD